MIRLLLVDSTKPDGTPRKVLDVSKANEMGWKAKTAINEGLATAYASYCNKIMRN